MLNPEHQSILWQNIFQVCSRGGRGGGDELKKNHTWHLTYWKNWIDQIKLVVSESTLCFVREEYDNWQWAWLVSEGPFRMWGCIIGCGRMLEGSGKNYIFDISHDKIEEKSTSTLPSAILLVYLVPMALECPCIVTSRLCDVDSILMTMNNKGEKMDQF